MQEAGPGSTPSSINLRLSLHPRTNSGDTRDTLLPEACACPGSLRNSTLGTSGMDRALGSCSSKVNLVPRKSLEDTGP